MNVSALLSGLLDPGGAGFRLAQAAARLEVSQTGATRSARASSSAGKTCACGEASCDCGKSRFETRDSVEFSGPTELPAASAYGPNAATAGTYGLNAATRVSDVAEHQDNADKRESDTHDADRHTAIAAERDSSGKPLNEKQKAQVEELRKRDAEVRQHEAAHQGAAGGLTKGGPSYSYETGPDGKQYAVGGEVQVDTSPVRGDPAATIAKLERVRAAALAPADPSGQDRSVASQAAAEIDKARAELVEQRGGERADGSAGNEDDLDASAADGASGKSRDAAPGRPSAGTGTPSAAHEPADGQPTSVEQSQTSVKRDGPATPAVESESFVNQSARFTSNDPVALFASRFAAGATVGRTVNTYA